MLAGSSNCVVVHWNAKALDLSNFSVRYVIYKFLLEIKQVHRR